MARSWGLGNNLKGIGEDVDKVLKGLTQNKGLGYFKLIISRYLLQGGILFCWLKRVSLSQPDLKLQSFSSAEGQDYSCIPPYPIQGESSVISRVRRKTSFNPIIESQVVLFQRVACWEMTKCQVWLNIMRPSAVCSVYPFTLFLLWHFTDSFCSQLPPFYGEDYNTVLFAFCYILNA